MNFIYICLYLNGCGVKNLKRNTHSVDFVVLEKKEMHRLNLKL